jgi:hypothetical protein
VKFHALKHEQTDWCFYGIGKTRADLLYRNVKIVWHNGQKLGKIPVFIIVSAFFKQFTCLISSPE